MSSTSLTSLDHINESIAQIVLTEYKERVMEMTIGSAVENSVFALSDDESTFAVLAYDIVDALTRLEPRIIVTEDDVTVASYENILIAEINYIIKEYNTSYSQMITLGGVK